MFIFNIVENILHSAILKIQDLVWWALYRYSTEIYYLMVVEGIRNMMCRCAYLCLSASCRIRRKYNGM